MLLLFAILLALIVSGVALYRYGDIQRQNPIVTVAVLIAWCFSLLIVFTIPLDITSTVYRQCVQDHNGTTPLPAEHSNKTIDEICQRPWGMVPDDVFPQFWRIIYWSSQFLTWLILPLLQSFLRAGDFTFKGKLKSSLIENMIYYGIYLVICIILLIYLALKPGITLDWPKLKAIASSASNTWGLFLLILLFGYALVEVPRTLWNNANSEFTLKYAYFKISKLNSEKSEAEEKVDEVLESVNAINRILPQSHNLRPCLDEILRKVPTELFEKYGRHNFGSHASGQDQQMAVPSEKSLIRLHRNVIQALEVLQRTEALWNIQVSKVLHLEDVVGNRDSADGGYFVTSDHTRSIPRLMQPLCSPQRQWLWYVRIRPRWLKALAMLTAALSLLVVWSEVTFFSRAPVLSFFALVIGAGKRSYNFLSIEIFSMLILCYLCYCAFSTVFQIKFLNLYYLAPHHQTNEHSLIFCGTTLCRLTAPMCLNFLGMIHMDSHIIKRRISETFYTQIMGHMDVLGIIADGFNIYFPMLMVAFCLATWFSLGRRALNTLGFDQFMIDEQISTELIVEGKELIGREKRKRQRAAEAIQRRANLTSTRMDDFGGGGGNSSFGVTSANMGGSTMTAATASGNRQTKTSRDGLLTEGGNTDYATRGTAELPNVHMFDDDFGDADMTSPTNTSNANHRNLFYDV